MAQRSYRTVAYLTMPPLVAATLAPLATRWSKGDREGMGSAARGWRSRGLDPKIPMWPLDARSWRVLPGGITFRIPGFSERCVALIEDPGHARRLWDMEQVNLRSASYLMLSLEGRWLLSARYRYKEDYIARRKRTNGVTVWVKKHGRARWYRAPDGWPRDKHGRPLKVREITRAVIRGDLGEEALAHVSARTAADVRRRLRQARDSDGVGHSEHHGGTQQ